MKDKEHVRALPQRLVCESCVQMTIRYPKPCSSCARRSVALFGRLDERLCASCAGHGPPPFACKACGTEDAGRQGKRCFRCKKADAIAAVVPSGHLPEEGLARLRALIDRPDMTPRGVVEWCEQSKAAALLRQMARGEIAATRASLNSMPQSRATAQLQALLIESGIITPGDNDLDRYVQWSQSFLMRVQPAADRMLLAQYSRWSIERKLALTTPATRRSDTTRLLVAKYQLEAAALCVDSLRDKEKAIEGASQGDIDTVLVEHRNRRRQIIAFLRWAHENRSVRYTKPTHPKDSRPTAPMPEPKRQQHIARLLEDDSIALATRVAGLFLLVFGQSIGRIAKLRTTAFSDVDGQLFTRLGRDSVRIPPPMDRLVRAQIDWSDQHRAGAEPWLFTGYAAGAHLTPDALARGLKRLGIQPTSARNAAMLDLAASMPARVLSDLMGYANGTAERWAQVAGRRWASYPSMRRR
ncbi:hypothetical protein NFX31_06045 [Microbacterium azadirachtae]|uniref:hypothetical protein n=1 Tax=Microbacterium azadirachtae TaxID=582680 RepID=UPI0021D511A9|nr:hypothetical protein [Microbacterium azadirachtae]UXW87083.1 hypothetical protein NFX31_06045 [Microbacterium azadirachtae]